MNTAASNPRAVIGANFPPVETAIDRAALPMEALRNFLNTNPVISTEEEARDGKKAHDDAAAALRSVEFERKGKVDPLNAEVKKINGEYHKLHNADKKTGTWDRILTDVRSRLTNYARELERQRYAAEERLRIEAEEAAEAARRAAEAEAEARDAAAAGVCDAGLAEAMEAADTTSQEALRKMWTARRAEKETKVRIAGGSANAMSLKDHETLHVTDWRAAIEEMSGDDGRIPQDIADAILKCARAHRKEFGGLPSGITKTFERSL